jgi:hypothetical protein
MSDHDRDAQITTRLHGLSTPELRAARWTDVAAHLQYEVTRDLLISCDDAMKVEGVPLDVRDRIIDRTICGGDPADVAERRAEQSLARAMAIAPASPH